MSLFVCSQCRAVDNTAVTNWADRISRKLPPLCSECDPKVGKWHGKFPKAAFTEADRVEVINPPPMAEDEKYVQFLKKETDDAWLSFKEAAKGVETVASIADCVRLRTLVEHRLSAFHVHYQHNVSLCKELDSMPAPVGDGFVEFGELCRSRWVQGMEWILKLQALIDDLCSQRDCPDHGHLFEPKQANAA